ncbi:glycosylphosphatidylinositol transamidase [Kwoniella heveanensis BCC8398]|uniref:Glycosylphosphatidylinositol transamidase n=1 Tax=Kwoniella heveanensis BCC8398 TaxID=1296120 RepID=A0A1B9GLQ1_9TREE|nr:glycosylphosphatidylinositol transamidase [Kwoniella heveanensis BCC8398]
MLSRLRRRTAGPRPDPQGVNFTSEHLTAAKTLARRKQVINAIWVRIPILSLWSGGALEDIADNSLYFRFVLALVGIIWLLAIPYEGLWKRTYVDEHALQPSQVTMYFDWAEVHKADRYLDTLEKIVNGTFDERTAFLQESFSISGLATSNTSTSTYAHIRPPRSKGTETILVSANWVSRDGTPNLRGIATLLALGDFLQGQNHWASDLVLVVGEGYVEGLEGFMREYHNLFPGVIWTGLNIDYPGHSFSHLGMFYEGVNGRLPNQDIVNAASNVARYAGGVLPRLHDVVDEPPAGFGSPLVQNYLLGAKHLLHHFAFMATGRGSAAHGVLARHRIDALTLYASPAEGPHGFHTLGRTIESTLRSMNNLLERLHASYFFYLLPRPDQFIPVGHYLPAAVLLGASLTIGGFDCPSPLEGLGYILPAFAVAAVAWIVGLHPIFLAPVPLAILPRPQGQAHTSAKSLTLLFYGALIPTLAMVNFPQAVVLALISLLYLTLPKYLALAILAIQPGLILALAQGYWGLDLQKDWLAVGNLTWPGVYAVWLPLWMISVVLL